ncbi:hypothetical protein [Amphritea sp. HPY]|uniref:hypothetical protein n=1 Tax=Amphritea sp. HPY TaxID=3421652 RepID=UPI003D7E8AC8
MTTMTRKDVMTLLAESRALNAERTEAITKAITLLDTQMDTATVTRVITMRMAAERELGMQNALANLLRSTAWTELPLMDLRLVESKPTFVRSSDMELGEILTISQSTYVMYEPRQEVLSHRKFAQKIKISG